MAKIAGITLAGLGLILAMFAAAGAEVATTYCTPRPATADVGSPAVVEDLAPEQVDNARTVIAVGQKLRIPEYGWVVALATAMQESTLRNLDYGDRDSLGLFQQRANWGSVAERTDPVTSSTTSTPAAPPRATGSPSPA